MSGKGKYYDGKKPVSIPVTWQIIGDLLILHVVENGNRLPSWDLKLCRQDVDQNTAFVLKNTETDEFLEIEGDHSAIPSHLIREQKVIFNAKIFAGIVAGLILFFIAFWFSIPHITKYLAYRVPYEYEQKAGDVLIKQLGDDIKACTPEEDSKEAFSKILKRIDVDKDVTIEIVQAKEGMVNAFTLPGGRIIVFKELIKSARSPEEVATTLAHEIGHVKNRHIIQKLIQALGFTAMFQMIGGDFSSALALDPSTVLSISSLKFDRSMETEADIFALNTITKAKIDPLLATEFFKKNEDMGIPFISSHPDHEERIKRLSQPIDFKPEPILTEKEWKALQAYCDVKAKPVKPLFKLKRTKNDSLPEEPQGDLRSRFQFPQRF